MTRYWMESCLTCYAALFRRVKPELGSRNDSQRSGLLRGSAGKEELTRSGNRVEYW